MQIPFEGALPSGIGDRYRSRGLKWVGQFFAASGCALLYLCVATQASAQTSSYGTNTTPVGPSVTSLTPPQAAGQPAGSGSTGGYSAPRPSAPAAMAAPATLSAPVAPAPLGLPIAKPGSAVQSGAAVAEDGASPVTIDADYKIGSNDLLEVEVFGVNDLKRTVRVNSTGHISLPLIGAVPVAGLTASDAQALIALQYSKDYLQDPQVSIFIKEFTSQRITVDGAVVRPGIYPLVGQITLLRALAMAGGGAQLSDLEQVVLFRITPDGKSETQRHDVNKIRQGEAPDPIMQGDDILVVNRNSARVGLRDSIFSDILNTLNPFSSTYRNIGAP